MRYAAAIVAILFAMAPAPPVMAADVDAGVTAIRMKRYAEALTSLLPLANAGNNEAQRLIGEMSYNGQGMRRDLVASFKWNELAAAGGDILAQYNLGYLYERGEGVGVSRAQAISWYLKSAVQGYSPAKHKLGDLYAEAEPDKALYWYDGARVNGDAEAGGKYAALLERRAVDVRAAASRVDDIDRAHAKAERRETERRNEAAFAEIDTQDRKRQMERARERADDAATRNAPYVPSAVTGMARLQGIQREADAYGAGVRASSGPSASSPNQGSPRPGDRAPGSVSGSTKTLVLSSGESPSIEAEKMRKAATEQKDRVAKADADAKANLASIKASEDLLAKERATKHAAYCSAEGTRKLDCSCPLRPDVKVCAR